MIGIYKIISPTNRVYIGQSVDIEDRKRLYIGHHAKNQTKLYNSFLKYGFINHKFESIEECKEEELNVQERYWQEFYNVIKDGLNCRLTKTTDKSGKLSEETCKKIGLGHKGKIVSDETKFKISIAGKGRFCSDETKLKRNAKLKGLIRTEETRKLMSQNNSQRKSVICIESGKIWTSITDCATELNIKPKTLNNKLTGFRKNNTTIRYLNYE